MDKTSYSARIHDTKEYVTKLADYIGKYFNIDDIERIEFLPYHKIGSEKYIALNIDNPYENLNEMNQDECNKLYDLFMKIYKSKF